MHVHVSFFLSFIMLHQERMKGYCSSSSSLGYINITSKSREYLQDKNEICIEGLICTSKYVNNTLNELACAKSNKVTTNKNAVPIL